MKITTCSKCHIFQSIFSKWTFCICGSSATKLLQDGRSVSVWGAAKVFHLDDRDYLDHLYSGVGNIKLILMMESNPRLQRCKEKPEL
jgi:hypothetical protein